MSTILWVPSSLKPRNRLPRPRRAAKVARRRLLRGTETTSPTDSVPRPRRAIAVATRSRCQPASTSGRRCCIRQPPHSGKWGQGGSARPSPDSSSSSARAARPSPRGSVKAIRTRSPGAVPGTKTGRSPKRPTPSPCWPSPSIVNSASPGSPGGRAGGGAPREAFFGRRCERDRMPGLDGLRCGDMPWLMPCRRPGDKAAVPRRAKLSPAERLYNASKVLRPWWKPTGGSRIYFLSGVTKTDLWGVTHRTSRHIQ